MNITSFKAYDVRGRIPDELNEDIAYRIGNAVVEYLGAKSIVVGRDIRESSDILTQAAIRGITDAGATALDIGLGGTEMVYFGTGHLEADGGIMITASHNPADYNGLKIVRREARPISGDTGLAEIREFAERDQRVISVNPGVVETRDILVPYIEKLLSQVDTSAMKPLKIVANPGNGGAGIAVDPLIENLPFDVVKMHYEADGSFPNGVPNPMLEENRQSTSQRVLAENADMGVAWDGDFDRCFFFDETGRFVEGYYLVALLAESVLKQSAGEAIVYDPRLVWATEEVVAKFGGKAVLSQSGHSFMKDVMRENDAAYGGEMSAHHYFRDFYYCDSGMIPWLLVAQLISESGKSLSQLVDDCIVAFPISGEINRRVDDAQETISRIRAQYEAAADSISTIDGVSMSFDNWRFNLRASNTEPVIRLNIESLGDADLVALKTKELLDLIGGTS
ncbi:MAG: phosphomannomutase [Pseudomonadota bacterium]